MYKIINDRLSGRPVNVYKIDEKLYIPMDENNMDYQRYLQWVAENPPTETSEGTE